MLKNWKKHLRYGATVAEIQLLDLSLQSVIAGEVLVGTGAGAAAWQKTGVILSAPDISGTVTAAATLTMPAFTLGSTVTLNGQVFDAGAVEAEIDTTGDNRGLLIQTTNATAYGGELTFTHIKGTPAIGDRLWTINAYSNAIQYSYIQLKTTNVTGGSEAAILEARLYDGGANVLSMYLAGSGEMTLAKMVSFNNSVDSAAVADRVSLGGYEISAGHRALAISSEEVVVTAAAGASDEYLPVRINGATYKLLLHS